MAATALNKLVELYMDHHLEVHKSPQSYKFFQDQSQILMNKHKDTEDRLEAFKKQHNMTSLDEERSLLLGQEGALRAELNRTLSQVAETENRIVQIQQQLAATPRTIPTGEETEHSPYMLNTLQGQARGAGAQGERTADEIHGAESPGRKQGRRSRSCERSWPSRRQAVWEDPLRGEPHPSAPSRGCSSKARPS